MTLGAGKPVFYQNMVQYKFCSCWDKKRTCVAVKESHCVNHSKIPVNGIRCVKFLIPLFVLPINVEDLIPVLD